MALVASAGPVTSFQAPLASQSDQQAAFWHSVLTGWYAVAVLHTTLVATNFFVFALGLITLGHDGGQVAASCGVAGSGGHGRHGDGYESGVSYRSRGSWLSRSGQRMSSGRAGVAKLLSSCREVMGEPAETRAMSKSRTLRN